MLIHQMSYTPPRGPCSQKNTYLIPCTCLRFMVHPLKAASSFECDGCGHHASFHKMDNQKEEEITRRWKVEEAEKARGEKANGGHQRLLTYGDVVGGLENEGQAVKRRRIADRPTLLDSPSIAASKKRTR